MYREDENRKYSREIEKLNNEITSLKMNEIVLMKNIDELKENLSNITSERNEILEENEHYQNELENIQKMLYNETESASKSSTKVILLTRQLDEEQKRAKDATHQSDEFRMQLKSSSMTNDTLITELNQARSLIHEHIIKVYIYNSENNIN
jgi:chromosome segregation ATPase